MSTLHFHFDYACPWCYVGAHTVRDLAKEGVEVIYHVWKMPPNANPPAKPEGYREAAGVRLKQLREEQGIRVSSPVQSETVPALIATKVAEQFGQAAAYVEAVYRAHWAEKQDIADRDVLVALAEAVGLNGAEFRQALESDAGRAAYERDLQLAIDENIDTIPDYINGNDRSKRLLIHHFDDMPTLEQLRELAK
jgi:predicted DsbA family dithiol-disulfide isomerase